MKTTVEEKFSEFFEKWVAQLEELLRLMVVVGPTNSEDYSRGLVSKVTAHVKAYYTAKWAAAREDVLPFYSPVWVSPLEASFLWVTGWKPSTVFRLLDSLRGKATMSAHQARRIDELRLKIRADEERVDRDMERQQVAVADRRMVELTTRAAAAAAAEGLVEAAVGGMVAGLERVMKAADCVRLKALKGVLDELSPPQCVELLAALAMLQLQLRSSSLNAASCCSSISSTTSLT